MNPISVEYSEHLKNNYLQYALSVITDRAIPDARDGLKPVQRRILYSSGEMGLSATGTHRKSARIVGEVLGKFHPHGDGAVYMAMVRLAQEFSTRYLLMDGQGNFGSVDGDPPAALRYTEARLSPLAERLLDDLENETVEFRPNFDGTLLEPTVLPVVAPLLLANGATGIAVGMQTQIPPHNMSELIDALIYLQDHPDCSVGDLMRFVKGPDFPLGGVVVGKNGVRQMYETGEGRFQLRGEAGLVQGHQGRQEIVISSIPYQGNKATIIEEIAELIDSDALPGAEDVRDESDGDGIRIVVELRRGANGLRILNTIYNQTGLQQTYSARLIALVDGRPKTLSLKDALSCFLSFKQNVVFKRTEHLVSIGKQRLATLRAIKKAVDMIDSVISVIRNSKSASEARIQLMSLLDVDEEQARSILAITLQRLITTEITKLTEEIAQTERDIVAWEDILNNKSSLHRVVSEELLQVKTEFGDKRRTSLIDESEAIVDGSGRSETSVPTIISLSAGGYLKRHPNPVYHRATSNDAPSYMHAGNSTDRLLLFTSEGNAFGVPLESVEEQHGSSRGVFFRRILRIPPKEDIVGLALVSSEDDPRRLFMTTAKGYIKSSTLGEYYSNRSQLQAIHLEKGDRVVSAWLPKEDDSLVLLGTKQGWGIMFPIEQVPTTGRVTRGVIGVRVRDHDELLLSLSVEGNNDFVVVFENKKPLILRAVDVPVQRRAGRGFRLFPDGTSKYFLMELSSKYIAIVTRGNEFLVVETRGQVPWIHSLTSIAISEGVQNAWAVPDLSSEGRVKKAKDSMDILDGSERDVDHQWRLFTDVFDE